MENNQHMLHVSADSGFAKLHSKIPLHMNDICKEKIYLHL
jgi:hypothetical protein